MQHQTKAQTVNVSVPLTNEDFRKNPKIRDTRNVLLGILSINLVFITLSWIIRSIFSYNSYSSSTIISDILAFCFMMALCIIRMILVYKINRIGIAIFAWFYLILLILALSWGIYNISNVSTGTNDIKAHGRNFSKAVFSNCIRYGLEICIIMYSFRLANLIKKFKRDQMAENI